MQHCDRGVVWGGICRGRQGNGGERGSPLVRGCHDKSIRKNRCRHIGDVGNSDKAAGGGGVKGDQSGR